LYTEHNNNSVVLVRVSRAILFVWVSRQTVWLTMVCLHRQRLIQVCSGRQHYLARATRR